MFYEVGKPDPGHALCFLAAGWVGGSVRLQVCTL